ncbi:hypothetical protein E4U58_002619 [Claviceps cyperi]|nr:hypothetical protein E4U58_002619 [Claviceps cyperi]
MLFAVFLLSLGMVSAYVRPLLALLSSPGATLSIPIPDTPVKIAEESQACVHTATCSWNPRRQRGQSSPYSPASFALIKKDVPPGCKVTFASVLSRHGSLSYRGEEEDLPRTASEDPEQHPDVWKRLRAYQGNTISRFLRRMISPWPARSKRCSLAYSFSSATKIWPEVSSVLLSGNLDPTQFWTQRIPSFAGILYAKRKNPHPHLSSVLVISEEDDAKNPLNHGTCKRFEDGLKFELVAEKKNACLKIWAPSVMHDAPQ